MKDIYKDGCRISDPPLTPMVTPHLIFLFVEIETRGFDRSMVTIYKAPH